MLNLKRLFCKHNFQINGHSPTICFPPVRYDYTYDVLKCSKCGKTKGGNIRKLTDKEKEELAMQTKQEIYNEEI